MTLPHQARNAVRYDAVQHVVHALDWHGAPLQLQTPAELLHAIATRRCYATQAIIATGIALCYAHGVAPDMLPLTTLSPLLAPLGQLPAHDFPAALGPYLQRLDRANERAARLAVALCTNDDRLVIADDDGVFAHTMIRILMREKDMPTVHVHHLTHVQAIPTDASIALIVGTVDEYGNTPAQFIIPDIPHYLVACAGPQRTPVAAPTVQYHAVVTARGIYRPDRVTQYLRDGDMGSDIIALG